MNRALISVLVLTATALQAQNILGQFSVPHTLGFSGPYFVESQFATPDGAGNLILFNPANTSLHKFDSVGKEVWSASVNLGSGQGVVGGMALTADSVYLSGQTNGILPGQTSAGSFDAFVIKYDLNGKALWARQFGTADGEYLRAIAPYRNGVYVIGVTTDGKSIGTGFLRRLDADGNTLWTRAYDAGTPRDVFGAAADSTGVYFYGYDIVRRFDSTGNDAWTRQLASSSIALGVAPDDAGVYVLHFAGSPEYSVRRLDIGGNELWTRKLLRSSYSGVIAADSTGFYVAGVTSDALPGQCYAGQGDVFLMRLDRGGNTVWTREFGTAGPERPAEISIGASIVDVTGFKSLDTAFLTTIEKSSAPITDSQPRILSECVLNAANYLGGGVAPGEIVTIFGSAMGPSGLVRLQLTPDGRVPTTLAGVRILFNGEPAPLISVSDKQSSAIVPYDVAGKATVDVQVEYKGVRSSAVTMPVFESRLGLFTFGSSGTGQAAIVNEDGTINSSLNPAARGSVVSIYGTGGGLPQPAGADDQITADQGSKFKSSAYIRLTNDGSCDSPYFAAEVLYYGGAPRSVPGLVQINARLPLDVPAGDAVPLYIGLSPDAGVEQVVTIAIR